MKGIAQGELRNIAFEFQTSVINVSVTNDIGKFTENFNLNIPSVEVCLVINGALMILFNIIGYIIFRFSAAPKSNLGKLNQDSKTDSGLKNIVASPDIPLNDITYDGASVVSHSTLNVSDMHDFEAPPISLGENRGRDSSVGVISEFSRLPRNQSRTKNRHTTNDDNTNVSIPKNSGSSSPKNSITFSDLSYFNG